MARNRGLDTLRRESNHRAKRKIADAGIPYRVRDPDELGDRLDEVLAVIYPTTHRLDIVTRGRRPRTDSR